MDPIKQAIEAGTISPIAYEHAFRVVEMYPISQPGPSFWAIVRGEGTNLRPLGDEQGMFKYPSEEEADADLAALVLATAEIQGHT